MHSPANCPAVVPERESSFFHNLCPEPSEKICSFQETRTSLEMHFSTLFFHNRGQVKNNNKLAFQTFSGTLPA